MRKGSSLTAGKTANVLSVMMFRDRMPSVFAPFEEGTRERPFVIAQLGQSLDGRIATPTGDSKFINRDAGLDHLHRIRAQVDAVVVGVATAIADDPLLTVRRVPGRNPARVVIDPRGRLPAGARCLADDGAQRYVIRTLEAPLPPGVEPIVLPASDGALSPHLIVRALGDRGFRRILVEGGARTISAFIDAEAVDRLHVVVAPLLLGCGRSGFELKPIAALSEAIRPQASAYVLPDGDVLFDCDMRRLAPGRSTP